MYHVGQPTKHRRRLRRLLLGVGAAVLFGGIWGWVHLSRTDTVIQQALPSTTHVAIATPHVQTVTKPGFRLKLPADWKPIAPDRSVYTEYSWQGATKADDARRLDVYVDTIPTTMAINRMLPIQASGNGVTPLASVSDNCINFTARSTANPQTGAAPAAWSGIAFLCDAANTLRDVVGTSSADGINTISVKGSSGMAHHFFFVYTDNSAQADYDTFTTILASFQAL